MVVTERELRARLPNCPSVLVLRPGDILTPAARDFVRTYGITVEERGGAPPAEMTRTPIPQKGANCRYVDAEGGCYAEKPEQMTHLYGNVLVPKTHPRIELRGKLDSLQAEILCAQVQADKYGSTRLCAELGELLQYVREILASEVKREPFCEKTLLGYTAAELRAVSHDPQAHFGIPHLVPDYTMGPAVAQLNLLRTRVREAELSAARAFAGPDGPCEREDLIQALNRLSSAFYVLICRENGTAKEKSDG